MRQKGNVLIIVIIIISLLGTVGYLYFKNTQLQKNVGDNALQSATPSGDKTEPSKTSDPTAEWNKFTNEDYSFKYPLNWDTCIIGENSNSRMVGPKDDVDKVRNMKGGFGGGTFLTFTITTLTEKPVWETDEYWTVTSAPFKVGGLDATKYNISVIQDGPGFSTGDKITSVLVKRNDKFFQLELLKQMYKDIYDQIVSSFKFVD
jgi:hypothetical protein